jgi:hypothetical protein
MFVDVDARDGVRLKEDGEELLVSWNGTEECVHAPHLHNVEVLHKFSSLVSLVFVGE